LIDYLIFFLRKFFGRHHELFNRYEVLFLQMTQNLFVMLLFISVTFTSFTTFAELITLSFMMGAMCGAETVGTSIVPEFIPGYLCFCPCLVVLFVGPVFVL
jgi:hypothetical protein